VYIWSFWKFISFTINEYFVTVEQKC